MILSIILFVLGIIILVKGADIFIDGIVSVAERLRIPELFIGLTLIAFGSSIPVLAFSAQAIRYGYIHLAVGAAIGTSIAGILLGLGSLSLSSALTIHRHTIWREIPFVMLSSLLLFTIGSDLLVDGTPSVITHSEGLTLLIFFALYLGYMFLQSAKYMHVKEYHRPKLSTLASSGYIILGLAGLIFGSYIGVQNSISLSNLTGVSHMIIGTLAVAISITVVELISSLNTIKQGKTDVVVGTIIGATIFNSLALIGSLAFFTIIDTSIFTSMDLLILAFSTLLLFVSMFVGKKHSLEPSQGFIMIVTYILYITYVAVR